MKYMQTFESINEASKNISMKDLGTGTKVSFWDIGKKHRIEGVVTDTNPLRRSPKDFSLEIKLKDGGSSYMTSKEFLKYELKIINEAITNEEFDTSSIGYKEGRKLVDSLRRGLFKRLSDEELDAFIDVLSNSFDLVRK
jgi:hypothetical protein